MNEKTASVVAYSLALLIGAGVAFWMFPVSFLSGMDAFNNPPVSDPAQHIIGQRYFLADAWRWPLLEAKALMAPGGLNIAFTDSIPLLSLITKLFKPLLRPGAETITLWLGLCWVLQPVAAVFALRSAGEKRIVPAVAVALIAVSMPTLYLRYVHEALSSHFLILLAIGVYFRMVRQFHWRQIGAAVGLAAAALLIHPYLMAMVVAVLAAAPVSLAFRKDGAWLPAGIGIVAAIAVTAALALALGYGEGEPVSGFGYYSINLLSPIYPAGSAMMPGFGSVIDATGGQYEGYQYLGLGLIAITILAAAVARPSS